MRSLFGLTSIIGLLVGSTAAYTVKKTWDASNFFEEFNFYSDVDPTHGFVNYVDKSTASSAGLAKITNGKVIIGADSTSGLDPHAKRGRRSVRLESNAQFDRGLIIGDFDHLPGNACGIWPSFWVIDLDSDASNDLPYSEIDIIEGVALQDYNEISLYTSHQCTLSVNNRRELGNHPRFNCFQTADESLPGCGINAPPNTFGDTFNAHNGGVWALQVEAHDIRVFFFPHGRVPTDIAAGNPNPDGWGNAVLDWKPDQCDIGRAFKKLNTVFNIAFCGDNYEDAAWGGEDWTGCARKTGVKTCEEWVARNPRAFKEAYFVINSVKWFQR
ncbi:glycoside hydrolase family 16 protein [Mytilinidion resinicola]|uniref:Glycoside hydrolase family 16 protein n=1 Tax=Mytilinidion resinicola TaxID=574789 RepID=A0A6A6Z9B2_9PEZI|nr:glycoside hydrolase family 16 protein [Mytilinidion resinicola]KAF2817289.1 glycoside hydrolase family 16 protein [Mytilinidion resinicola]